MTRAHKKFQRGQQVEMYLLALKAQDEGKIEWTIPLFDKLLNSENQLAQLNKSIQISYNCQVRLQNIIKCGKYSPVKLANFVYFCITQGKALPLCGNVVANAFSCVIQKCTKFANFTLLYFRHFRIFYNQTSPFP